MSLNSIAEFDAHCGLKRYTQNGCTYITAQNWDFTTERMNELEEAHRRAVAKGKAVEMDRERLESLVGGARA